MMPAAPQPTPGRITWRAALAEFRDGFVLPSIPGASAAAVGFLCSLLLALWFFTPDRLSGPMGDYLPRSGRDAEAFAMVEALRVARDGGHTPTIVVLGPSTLGQAIGAGDTLMRRLKEVGLDGWRLAMLTTPLQSPLDQFALLDTALRGRTAESAPVFVLIGTGPTRPGWSAPDRQLEAEFRGRIGLTSTWERKERELLGDDLPELWHVPLVDNRKFFILNGTEAMLRLLLLRSAEREIDSYAHGKPNPEVMPAVASSIAALPERMDPYLQQMGRLLDQLGTVPGVHVALIEEPISPSFLRDYQLGTVVERLRAATEAAARQRHIRYFPLLATSRLTAADYHDILHLRPGPAQAAYQDALADRLVAAIAAEVKP